MSVMVIMEFPGATVEKFMAVYDRHKETMAAISADGRSKGAIHHMFVENGNGELMVVDEWGSFEEFEAFFGSQEDIKTIMDEAGVTGAPKPVSYRVVDSPDRF